MNFMTQFFKLLLNGNIHNNHRNNFTFTTFIENNLRSLLPPNTKKPRPRISLRVKTTYIYNQYYLYSIKCAYVSSMLEVVDFTVSY